MHKVWMAVYTKPRSEKKVAGRLALAGIEVYCPLYETIRQWSDRKKKIRLPIFPSYIFVCIEEKERSIVLFDRGVVNFVFYLGKPAVIRKNEIDSIKELFNDAEGDFEVSILQFNEGDNVDIIAGPFKENKGRVEKVNKSEITLLVESLGVLIRIKANVNSLTSFNGCISSN